MTSFLRTAELESPLTQTAKKFLGEEKLIIQEFQSKSQKYVIH